MYVFYLKNGCETVSLQWLTRWRQTWLLPFDLPNRSDQNCLSQLVVDIVPSVLDGDDQTALAFGNDRDRFAAVTAKGEQKRVKLLVVRLNGADDILLTFVCFSQRHAKSPVFVMDFDTAISLR